MNRPFFAFLYYEDNKTKYVDPLTGKKHSNKIKHDIKKLFTAFSISETIFILSKTYIHSSLLASSVQPYQAYAFAVDNIPDFNQISINVGTKALRHRQYYSFLHERLYSSPYYSLTIAETIFNPLHQWLQQVQLFSLHCSSVCSHAQ